MLWAFPPIKKRRRKTTTDLFERKDNGFIMRRKDARENAFKVLFEISFSDSADIEETMSLAAENMGYEFDDYCRRLINGVVADRERIDSVLNEFSEKWKTDRLSRVALCAAEIAVFETDGGEVPPPVAVNEAVELIKKFDTEESAKYINGVLGGYVRSRNAG